MKCHLNQSAAQTSRCIFLSNMASVAMFSTIGILSTATGQKTAETGFLASSQRLTDVESLAQDTASAVLDAFQRIGDGEAVNARGVRGA